MAVVGKNCIFFAVINLKLNIFRSKGGTAEDLKEKLLRLLLAQSSNLLMGSGCPLDEVSKIKHLLLHVFMLEFCNSVHDAFI